MSVAVRQYRPDEAEKEINRWIASGWTIQSVTSSDGHANVGRTVMAAYATGGLSLLLGLSRSKGKITVIFEGGSIVPPTAAQQTLQAVQSLSPTEWRIVGAGGAIAMALSLLHQLHVF